MPYIKQIFRDAIDREIESLLQVLITLLSSNQGALNYTISRIVTETVNSPGTDWSYDQICQVTAAFENAKLEFYRRVAGPKEDQAIIDNGDIPAYDT